MTPQQRMCCFSNSIPIQNSSECPQHSEKPRPGSYLPQSQDDNLPSMFSWSDFRKYIQALNATLDEDETPYYVDERAFIEDSLQRVYLEVDDKK